jgi:uncharacterized protein (DUF2344 family)
LNMTEMINLEQAQHVEQYVFGSIFIVLVAALIYFIKRIEAKDADLKEISNKVIEALGENNEIIRNNTEVLNQIKGKIK